MKMKLWKLLILIRVLLSRKERINEKILKNTKEKIET
jgi:hypothetical protein